MVGSAGLGGWRQTLTPLQGRLPPRARDSAGSRAKENKDVCASLQYRFGYAICCLTWRGPPYINAVLDAGLLPGEVCIPEYIVPAKARKATVEYPFLYGRVP